ncbi:proline and serine-rich protein 3-like isoform X1 [Asterias rubens]|uniref:proline and serine-rich protein 3-like isoform X1 n=1 Tax=Asterias rubens TaxID=7604 RepID=UPI001455556F|nr:proline and serine-rich protein 3-like isoform X1 [Asterias rubens]
METLFFQSHHGTNPFKDEPLPPAHYHPSLQKQLSGNEKQTKLSPTRPLKNVAISSSSSQARPVEKSSPAEREFLRKRNTMLAKELPTHDTPSPGNASSKFDESWPTSERPSTIDSPGDYQAPDSSIPAQSSEIHKVPGTSRNTQSSLSSTGTDYLAQWRNRSKPGAEVQQSKPIPAEGSTLAKYIQRFRYSEPKSRQERQQDKRATAAGKDFWWLSPPSRTSTPSDIGDFTSASSRDATQDRAPHRRVEGPGRREGYRGRVTSSSSGSITEGEGPGRQERYLRRVASTSSASPPEGILDTETEELQSRAEKLLERSESTILSEPAVSSEGLGFSPGSSDYQEPKYVPREVPRPSPQVHMGTGYQIAPRKALRPEEDILHQWRVRRRLEEARRQTLRPGLQRDALQPEKPHFEGTRLEEFRNRLKQQEHISQIKSGTRQTNPSKPMTQTLGTDPMPQTIATQTNGTLPSTVENSPVRDGDIFKGPGKCSQMLEGSVQREPVRPHAHNLHRKTGRDVDHQLNYEYANEAEMGKPIIASPSIKQTNQTVPPHLHMACDIIPCRQDPLLDKHQHGDIKQSKDSTSNKWMKLRYDERDSSRATKDVSTFDPTTLKADSRSIDDDSIHVKIPRPAMHPFPSQTSSGHATTATQEETPFPSMTSRANSRIIDDDPIHLKMPRPNPATHLQPSQTSSRYATTKNIIMGEPQDATSSQPTTSRAYIRPTDLDPIHLKMKMPRPAKHFVSSQVSSRHTIAEGESSLERTRQRLEFEEEEETVQDGEGDETMQSGDDTLRVTADEDSEASMKTTPSGSNADESHGPTTSLLGAAVGQVISDRLFTTPKNVAASPEWSTDTLPSMHSSLQSHDSRVVAADQGRFGGEEVKDGSSTSSDGEEFAEDELLQLLRRRRAQHENQLQELDHLILARTSVT